MDEKLYLVNIFFGGSLATKSERYICDLMDKFDKSIVTENAKNQILAKAKELQKEFFEQNPRIRKDKDYDLKFTEGYMYQKNCEKIMLGSGYSYINFYQTKIIESI